MTNAELYARETLAVTLYESSVRLVRRGCRWTDLSRYDRSYWRNKADDLIIESNLININ